jgi:Peptidase family M28/PA domain
MRSPFFAFPALLALALPARAGEEPTAAALEAVRPAALEAHVRFLADDLLEGRGTGTRGHEIAARYVAAQFAAAGLEPAGDGGSFFQSVPLRRADPVVAECLLELDSNGRRSPMVLGTDFVPVPSLVREQAEVRGSVVYVGFGVTAPEFGYDDYAGVDVAGKVVAMLWGAPARFPNDARAFYSSRRQKAELAARHGAIGVVSFPTPQEAKRLPFERLVERMSEPSMAWLDENGAPDGSPAGLVASAALSDSGVRALFAGASRTVESIFEAAIAGRPASLTLPVAVHLKATSRHTSVRSPNVVGILRGSDPELSREYVVLSAHLDHLGIGPARNGDSIYNGAYDNASGSAALMEIAQAVTRLPRRPRRSLLFAAVTAEEKGLLGAEYFASHPTVPVRSIVADLNMDMFLTLYPLRDVVAFGGEHSSLGDVVAEMAEHLGLELAPDPFPEEVIFIRSDHFPFVTKGIPAVMLSSGLKSSDPSVNGAEVFGHWLSTVYHSPQDDTSQAMNFGEAARIARLYLLIAHRVAETPQRPTWRAGDFFGARFGH